MKKTKEAISWFLVVCLLFSLFVTIPSKAAETTTNPDEIVVNVLDYGADPTGVADSTTAIWQALQAVKEKQGESDTPVRLEFPKGEYHIYKDKAQVREYHTSNTSSTDYPMKTIGILIEEQKNLTVDGNGSLFIMHGNIMSLAVVKSENITLQDFSWDFAVPTVSEMTIVGMGTTQGGQEYTDFYIPACFPYEIAGRTIRWTSEKSPYTGEYYWTKTGIHERSYSVVGYSPDAEMTRAYQTYEGPFENVSTIEKQSNGTVRITYTGNRPAQQRTGQQKIGTVFEFTSSAVRETAGAFTWESTNVHAERVNVHFMHGFGWLIQMSTDVSYKECNFMPRENSGHLTVSYADIIHASGAKGEILIEDCNFSNSHDDPINLHGTFTRVEERMDAHTLKLKYIHHQQGGFPQFHKGDEVAFFTRDTLESTDEEKLYTVEEVVSEPGEKGNDLKTMVIRFQEELPEHLSEKIGNEPKYVAENVTFAPSVTIRNNTFRNVPTRGILCTTRNKVLIENNTFYHMSMATIFLSNDSDQWYESGPIRDMTIKNNTFYIKDIGRTSWAYAPAVYVHPVTKGGRFPTQDNPIHKNITIEGNTFFMDVDTVVYAESVENLKIKNNKIFRTNPDVALTLSAEKANVAVGETTALEVTATGDKNEAAVDNVYEFDSCKNVLLEGNTYDDGLKKYAVLHNMSESNLKNNDAEIQIASSRNLPASVPADNFSFVSSNPEIATVDAEGRITGIKAGTVEVYAYYEWNDTITKSNVVTVTVAGGGEGTVPTETSVDITAEEIVVLEEKDATKKIEATAEGGIITWSVVDFFTREATEVATVDQEGTVTAKKNGIVWVKASIGEKEDMIPVVVSLPEVEKLSPEFSVVRPNPAGYTLDKNSVTIDAESGDLYTNTNTVKNLILYGGNFERNNVRVVVKIDGLPTKEGNAWDTASFVLYKDDNNYITVGKKSHYDGFVTVREQGGTANEQGGSTSDNATTSAYFAFTNKGDGKVTVSYKSDGATTFTDLRELDASMLGNDYKIGFAAWESNDRGKKMTFSEFKVGTATTSYEDLLKQNAVVIGGFENEGPTVSEVKFEKNNYVTNDKVKVTYTFADKENHEEKDTRFLWEYTLNGVKKYQVTDVAEYTAYTTGTLKCTVIPVDEHGTPGTPVTVTTEIQQGTTNLSLDKLQINGIDLILENKEQTEFEVLIPSDLEKVALSYHSLLVQEGTTKVMMGSSELSDTENEGSLIANLGTENTITITRKKDTEEKVYTIVLRKVESNVALVDKIELPELQFSQNHGETTSWLVSTDKTSSQIRVTVPDSIGKLEVKYGHYREEIALTKEGNVYTGTVDFTNGLNSLYVQAIAKDGITKKQYMVHVVSIPDTTVGIDGITINGETIEVDTETSKGIYHVTEETETVDVQVDSTQQVVIGVNGNYVTEKTFADAPLKGGSNYIFVKATAADQITKVAYQIEVIKPYPENVEVFQFQVDGKDVLDQMDSEGKGNISVSKDAIAVEISTKDPEATIEVSSGSQKVTDTGSIEGTFHIYRETPVINVVVTARDQKTKKTYQIQLEKVLYLSDLGWRADSTVGYGSIQKDKASNGGTMQLPDENGRPVAFEKGVGTHADSTLYFELGEHNFQLLKGFVGVDYSQYNSNGGSIQFMIEADGEQLFDSAVVTRKMEMKPFEVEISGVSLLTLKALKVENDGNDHADWADVRLIGVFPEGSETPGEGGDTGEGEEQHTPSTEWSKDETNHWHSCTFQGCEEDQKHDVAAHTWDAGTVTKQPTETETGEKTFTCTVCEATKIESVPATGTSGGNNADVQEQQKIEQQKVEQQKTEIESLKTQGATFKSEEYTTETWNAYQNALNKVNTLISSGKATSTELEKAKVALKIAMGALVKAPATQTPEEKPEEKPQEKPEEKPQDTVTHKKNQKLTFKDASYKVTKPGKTGGEVALTKYNGKGKKFTTPKTITVDGVKYKVTSVANNAFKGNKTLTNIVISTNVKTIGNNVFQKCVKLTNVTIGKNVTKLGKNLFKNSKKLKTIVFKTTKLTANGLAKKSLAGIGKTTKVRVPKKQLNAYKKFFTTKGLSKSVKITK